MFIAVAAVLTGLLALHETKKTGLPLRIKEMAAGILQETGLFEDKEIEKICSAIRCHSDKKMTHGPLEEILKDADVMQHCLYDPGYVSKKEKDRYKKLRKELGIKK